MLVVASATGVQLADEIHRSGRPVALSVGEHVRLRERIEARRLWWMTSGVWNQRYDGIDDLARVAGSVAAAHWVGCATLDLNALSAGVELVGRIAADFLF